jgi:hypothetical protein
MTPKEKARELVLMFLPYVAIDDIWEGNQYLQKRGNAKKSALIAVDEILNAITFNMYDEEEYNKVNDFWEEVKSEIEKI